nr:uncharacterized protein LOC123745283 isoform X1 [Procambarus clarkii]
MVTVSKSNTNSSTNQCNHRRFNFEPTPLLDIAPIVSTENLLSETCYKSYNGWVFKNSSFRLVQVSIAIVVAVLILLSLDRSIGITNSILPCRPDGSLGDGDKNQTPTGMDEEASDNEISFEDNKRRESGPETSKGENMNTTCSCRQVHPKLSNTILGHLKQIHPSTNRSTSDYLKMQHPNFPVDAVMDMATRNIKCHLLPEYASISWVNTFWQRAATTKDVTLYLYSAVYDNRSMTADVQPCVRVLVISRSTKPPRPWCHLWFNATKPPQAVKALRVEYLDYHKPSSETSMPFLVTCPLPQEYAHLKPIAASLLPKPCTYTSNLLQVTGSGSLEESAFVDGRFPHSSRKHAEYTVAVCGPALYYYHQDFSFRLVEWLELLRAMGISRVFLYETDVHPNMEKVLRYYESQGFVEVTKYSYPPPYDNEPSTRRLWTNTHRVQMFAQENIYFSDCLLRHMHQHRFIAHFDPDEVPFLLHHDNFTHLINELLNKSHMELGKKAKSLPAGYKLQWNIFYDDLQPPQSTRDLPPYLHALRHTLRPKADFPQSPGTFKAIYDMNTVTGVFSHGPIVCGSGKCHSDVKRVDAKIAYLGHFTRTCGDTCRKEGYLKEDSTLLRYEEAVRVTVEKVLGELGLL